MFSRSCTTAETADPQAHWNATQVTEMTPVNSRIVEPLCRTANEDNCAKKPHHQIQQMLTQIQGD